MLAHHPDTGQPIRILRSDAQIAQDRKTLTWIKAGFKPSQRWRRWSTFVSDPAAMSVLVDAEPDCIFLRGEHMEAWKALSRLPSLQKTIFFASTSAMRWLRAHPIAGFDASKCLETEELPTMYPFLDPVDALDSSERMFVAVAFILRNSRMATDQTLAETPTLVKWRTACSGSIQRIVGNAETDIPPCWLIQQYFRHPMARRAREINRCLEQNAANPYIDRILLLNESATVDLPVASEKIIVRSIGARLTYADVLHAIRTELPDGAFAVFANADIWFDDSLRVLWTISLEERRLFLALLRWEESESAAAEDATLFGPRADSQDSWVIAKSTVDFEISDDEFRFPFGKPGCDNAIALAMLRKKCLVVNPAYSLRTYHVHRSNIRSYDPRDILYKPAYLYIDPTPIQSFRVEMHMKGREAEATPVWNADQPKESFARKLLAIDDETKGILATAFSRVGSTKWTADGANTWTPPPATQPLYEWKSGAFVSNTGLCSDFQSIYVGPHSAWRDGWASSEMSSLSPSIHVPNMISVSAPESCWTNVADWCLYYLPTVLRVRAAVGSTPEFIIPAMSSVPDMLYDFVWSHHHIGTVPHVKQTTYYADHLWAVAPPATAASASAASATNNYVSKEDVRRLRSLLPFSFHRNTSGKPTIAICLSSSSAIWSRGWAEELLTCQAAALQGWNCVVLSPKEKHVRRREVLQTAAWIVGDREALKWTWMARPGTKLLEWVLETDISDEIAHLAGAADCTYIASLVRKEPVEFQRQHAIVEFGRILQKFAFSELLNAATAAAAATADATAADVAAAATDSGLPIIHVPVASTGMFAHTGGGLREMVRLWEERKYCRLVEVEDGKYVWWGEIGGTLLYDWDTARWWNPETSYKFALFGNCPPAGPAGHETRQSVWSFWPAQPRAVETAVEQGLLPYEERTVESVFLGKVENGIQKQMRCSADWSSSVEKWSMPIDSTGKPYPYTQTEYLDILRTSRFGLCLPGYGRKCNREIEYMAMGVVPIITPGVDTELYLSPWKEGVHFLRAGSPEEVRAVIAATDQATWERMSAACKTWWRENASAEALFRITWARIRQCEPFLGIGVPPWNGGLPHH